MFHQLVSHNDDLRRMVEKGYVFSIDSGYRVIRDIPYSSLSTRAQSIILDTAGTRLEHAEHSSEQIQAVVDRPEVQVAS